jgi:hypothetical protein
MHGDDDEEGRSEEHAVIPEHAWHRERRDEHRDQRNEKGGADEAFLGVDGVRQPGVGRPRLPERAQHEHSATDPRERRLLRQQGRHLRKREHENKVEEELPRRDAVLLHNCRRGHPHRP